MVVFRDFEPQHTSRVEVSDPRQALLRYSLGWALSALAGMNQNKALDIGITIKTDEFLTVSYY